MRRLFRSWGFWVFIAAEVLALAVLAAGGRGLDEVLGSFVILGVLLPLAALASCRGLPAPAAPQPWRRQEAYVLIGLLAWIAAFLAVKGQVQAALLPASPDPRLAVTVNTLLKLAAFVAVPAIVIRGTGLGWRQAGAPTASTRRLWIIFLLLSLAAILIQYVLGTQFKRVFGDPYAQRHLAIAAVLCFVWNAVEAGLVEEFFFRWFLQTRLAAWTRSEVSGLFLGALLFGLAHAPGIVLRGAGVVEGLGEAPSLGTTLAYVTATQGVAGLMFGVLWSRTRSLWLLIALHAMMDTPAGLASFMDTWRL